jgi:hypothetical protein
MGSLISIHKVESQDRFHFLASVMEIDEWRIKIMIIRHSMPFFIIIKTRIFSFQAQIRNWVLEHIHYLDVMR